MCYGPTFSLQGLFTKSFTLFDAVHCTNQSKARGIFCKGSYAQTAALLLASSYLLEAHRA
eukprot:1008532-Prorocentrum_minimum.AAC.2